MTIDHKQRSNEGVWNGQVCKVGNITIVIVIPVTGRGGPQGCEMSKLPYFLDQGSPNYGPRATSVPRCDFIRPAKEQIIITAGVVLITTFAQFCSNCLLSLIYDNLFSRTLYLVYEMLYFQ
jgi:hypothetical protein